MLDGNSFHRETCGISEITIVVNKTIFIKTKTLLNRSTIFVPQKTTLPKVTVKITAAIGRGTRMPACLKTSVNKGALPAM